MRTVLVTGINGFIGRHVARQFCEHGWDVIGVSSGHEESAPLQVLKSYYRLRLPDSRIDAILQAHPFTLCIHCAGRASVPLSVERPDTDFHGNVVVTQHLLEALRRQRPNVHFVFLSSAAVYGDLEILPAHETMPLAPISPYGFHKRMCEDLCIEYSRLFGLKTTVLRIFSAYGPGLRRQVIWDMCEKAARAGILELNGTGKESRDFIHVRDIARAILMLGEPMADVPPVCNLGSGVETTIAELARLVAEAFHANLVIRFSGIQTPGNPQNWRADMSALANCGFRPMTSLQDGIRSYVAWYRAEVGG